MKNGTTIKMIMENLSNCREKMVAPDKLEGGSPVSKDWIHGYDVRCSTLWTILDLFPKDTVLPEDCAFDFEKLYDLVRKSNKKEFFAVMDETIGRIKGWGKSMFPKGDGSFAVTAKERCVRRISGCFALMGVLLLIICVVLRECVENMPEQLNHAINIILALSGLEAFVALAPIVWVFGRARKRSNSFDGESVLTDGTKEQIVLPVKRRNKFKFAMGAAAIFIVLVGIGVGLFFADNSGFLYGVGTISFTADGKTYTESVMHYNNYVTLDLPEKVGYDILGLRDTNSRKMLFNANGVSNSRVKKRDLSDFSDCNLEVVYDLHEYAASIRTDTGISMAAFTFTIEDDPEDVIEEPQHLDGYVFDGWFTDAKYRKPFSGNFKDYIDEPLVLYPHYSLDGWTISWDLQGGTMIDGVMSEYNILSDVPLPKGDVVTRRGYDLLGWSYKGQIIDYFPTVTMQDITLVAVWTPHSYFLTYDPNGGELDSTLDTFTVEDRVDLQIPFRAGYCFEGWFTAKNYRTECTRIEVGTVGDLTLHAKWTPITYNIVYDLAGGENTSLNPTTYNVERDVKLLCPKKKGYLFRGWYDVQSAEYKTELNAAKDGDVVLIAVWSAKNYTVTVCPDNGEPSYEQEVTYDAFYSLSVPSCKGYTFKGFTFGDEPFDAIGVYSQDVNAVIIAHFEANEYKISYISDGSNLYTQTVTYGQPYRLYLPDNKKNFEFADWYDAQVGGNKAVDGIYCNDYNISLYAVWTKVLTIDLESGKDYTVDKSIEKVYVTGNHTGEAANVLSDICIAVSVRDKDLTMCLINAGFKAKENSDAIRCENSSYTLIVSLSGNNYIEGGKGSDGQNGVSGSGMNESTCNGTAGHDGGSALVAGTVIFTEEDPNASLVLKGGDSGAGGNGGIDPTRWSRWWTNYQPCGGNSGSTGYALYVVAYSIYEANVRFEQGKVGTPGKAGYRGTWGGYDYGKDGSFGTTHEAVGKK